MVCWSWEGITVLMRRCYVVHVIPRIEPDKVGVDATREVACLGYAVQLAPAVVGLAEERCRLHARRSEPHALPVVLQRGGRPGRVARAQFLFVGPTERGCNFANRHRVESSPCY